MAFRKDDSIQASLILALSLFLGLSKMSTFQMSRKLKLYVSEGACIVLRGVASREATSLPQINVEKISNMFTFSINRLSVTNNVLWRELRFK